MVSPASLAVELAPAGPSDGRDPALARVLVFAQLLNRLLQPQRRPAKPAPCRAKYLSNDRSVSLERTVAVVNMS